MFKKWIFFIYFIRNLCSLEHYFLVIFIYSIHANYLGLAVNGHQLIYFEISPIEITFSKMHFY
jgi:hypothetical protein